MFRDIWDQNRLWYRYQRLLMGYLVQGWYLNRDKARNKAGPEKSKIETRTRERVESESTGRKTSWQYRSRQNPWRHLSSEKQTNSKSSPFILCRNNPNSTNTQTRLFLVFWLRLLLDCFRILSSYPLINTTKDCSKVPGSTTKVCPR